MCHFFTDNSEQQVHCSEVRADAFRLILRMENQTYSNKDMSSCILSSVLKGIFEFAALQILIKETNSYPLERAGTAMNSQNTAILPVFNQSL